MNRRIFLTGLLSLTCAGAIAAPAATFREGADYKLLAPPLPTQADGKVEVLELFWYRCPHCYELQPVLESWQKRTGKTIVYRRMPAVLGSNWAIHARAYYTAEALDVLERMHRPVFDALHAEQRNIGDEASLAAFFAEHGVDAARFRQVFNSFGVDSKVRAAADTTRRLRLSGVPAVVVNGRYLTSPAIAGGAPRMTEVLDFLIGQELRQARAG